MTQVTPGPADQLLATQQTEQFLHEVTALAVAQVAAGLSCGMLLQAGRQAVTVASSDTLAARLDAAQYELREGPALRAIATRRPVRIDDISRDAEFPAFGRRAAASRIRSVLSVPLEADGSAGALNLYGPEPAVFGGAERAQAQRLARHAAGALTLARQAALAGQLRAALASRAVIDQAIGVIMAQNRCSADTAFETLRQASQNRNVKLRQVAADIITSMSGKPPAAPPFRELPGWRAAGEQATRD